MQYSDVLINNDKELPILNSLSHHSYRSTSPPSSRKYDPPSHQEHNDQASASTQSVTAVTSEQSEQIFDLPMDPNSLQSKSVPLLSKSLNEVEMESSIQSRSLSGYSSSLRNPTIAENFTEAVAGQTNLDSENVIRSPRPEYSIKKLQLLTVSMRESKSKPRRRFNNEKQKSLKLSEAKSLQKISSDVSTTSKLDESEILEKKPKFFTSDMLCVIMERNELKERINQLEEKVQQLEE